MELARGHVAEKSLYLDELMEQILRHRREDLDQLADNQRDLEHRWLERLKRLETWQEHARAAESQAGRLQGWWSGAAWFEEAASRVTALRRAIESRIERWDRSAGELEGAVSSWAGSLAMIEHELRELQQRESLGGADFYISAARKKPFMDAVNRERDQEARLARSIRTVREAVSAAAKRLGRVDALTDRRTADHPSAFEFHRQSIRNDLHPLLPRLEALRERIMQTAIAFEDGRRRLRWAYDTVSKLRVLPDFEPPRRTFLQKLLNYEKE